MTDFFTKLERAWKFTFADQGFYRAALLCVRLQTHDGKVELHATDGMRLVVFTPDMSDLTGLDWDGEACNLPPTVRLLMAEGGDAPLVIRGGSVSRNGVSARVVQQDFNERFPEFRPKLLDRVADLPNVCELDGKELARLWKVKPPAWSIQERVKAMCQCYTLPKLRVLQDANNAASCANAGLRIYDDGPLLACGVEHPKEKDGVVGFEYSADRIKCREKNIDVKPWTSRVAPEAKPRLLLNARFVLDALNGRKGMLRYGDQFTPARIDFDGEMFVVMPMRMM